MVVTIQNLIEILAMVIQIVSHHRGELKVVHHELDIVPADTNTKNKRQH